MYIALEAVSMTNFVKFITDISLSLDTLIIRLVQLYYCEAFIYIGFNGR